MVLGLIPEKVAETYSMTINSGAWVLGGSLFSIWLNNVWFFSLEALGNFCSICLCPGLTTAQGRLKD